MTCFLRNAATLEHAKKLYLPKRSIACHMKICGCFGWYCTYVGLSIRAICFAWGLCDFIKTWNEFIKNFLKYVLFDCKLLVMCHIYQLLLLIKFVCHYHLIQIYPLPAFTFPFFWNAKSWKISGVISIVLDATMYLQDDLHSKGIFHVCALCFFRGKGWNVLIYNLLLFHISLNLHKWFFVCMHFIVK